MSGSRPAPAIFTRQQLAEWLSAPELALWPSTVTIDGLMRQAGAALSGHSSTAVDSEALALGQKLLDGLGTATPSEIETAVTALMFAVRGR